MPVGLSSPCARFICIAASVTLIKSSSSVFCFAYLVEARVELTPNAQQGGHETRGAGEGRTKQWGTETLGDLWKGEGWVGEHGVYKMDITGTSGRKAGNLKEVGLCGLSGVEKIEDLDGGDKRWW